MIPYSLHTPEQDAQGITTAGLTTGPKGGTSAPCRPSRTPAYHSVVMYYRNTNRGLASCQSGCSQPRPRHSPHEGGLEQLNAGQRSAGLAGCEFPLSLLQQPADCLASGCRHAAADSLEAGPRPGVDLQMSTVCGKSAKPLKHRARRCAWQSYLSRPRVDTGTVLLSCKRLPTHSENVSLGHAHQRTCIALKGYRKLLDFHLSSIEFLKHGRSADPSRNALLARHMNC